MQTEKANPDFALPIFLISGKLSGVYMYYYQHHIGDYRRDTSHLTLLEHGIYRQLLDLYYITEKPLDANALRLICARSADEVQATKQILSEFFIKEGDVYVHRRCEDEIVKFHTKSNKASLSAKVRWNKNKELEDANALQTQSEGNANHKPITNNHKPKTKKTNSPEFDVFWEAYPVKEGKRPALKAWIKANPPLDLVMKALEWQKETDKWKKGFIYNPATYINQEHWNDEPPANSRANDLQWFLGKQVDDRVLPEKEVIL